MESKKDIRTSSLQKRNQLTEKEWSEKTSIICKKVLNHPFFLESNTIYCYVDYRNEVGTRKIIEEAWKRGKKVAVPKIFGEQMLFGYLANWDELAKGYKGILEPNVFALAKEETPLVIMPGAAFDSRRNRIGYGKGYYDQFLDKHSKCNTLGLAFECQIVEHIPAEPFDICPQVLITEEEIYDDKFTK